MERKDEDEGLDELLSTLKEQLEQTFTGETTIEPVVAADASKQELISRIRRLEEQLAEKDRQLAALREYPEEEVLPSRIITEGRPEHRSHPRYRVDWRVAIVNEEGANRDIFYSRAYDVSLGGVSVLSDDNLFFDNAVVVLLCLPPLLPNGRVKIVEAHSRIVYTVLGASIQQFRLGIQFIKFKDDGQKVLHDHLARLYSYF